MISEAEHIKKQRAELERHRDDLERQAGVYELANNARDDSFFYLFNHDLPPRKLEEAERREAQRVNGKIRDIYFSVGDAQFRRDLIGAYRKRHQLWLESKEAWVRDAEVNVARATADHRRQPWEFAALFGVVCVAAGYGVAGIPGSIGGAVMGFFLGQGIIARSNSETRGAIEDAERYLEEARASRNEAAAEPKCFTFDEEISGEREANFG